MTRNERWAQMRRDGLTLAEIASADGVSRQRVHQVLSRMGVQLPGYRKLTEEVVREARSCTLTNVELGARYGVHRDTVRKARMGLIWKRLA